MVFGKWLQKQQREKWQASDMTWTSGSTVLIQPGSQFESLAARRIFPERCTLYPMR